MLKNPIFEDLAKNADPTMRFTSNICINYTFECEIYMSRPWLENVLEMIYFIKLCDFCSKLLILVTMATV